MKKNLDLIIILTLSLLVCGVLYLLYTDTAEYSMPKDGNIVMSRGGGSRHVAPRGATNGGTWTPEAMSGGVASSRSVRVASQSYRRSSMQATTTNSSLISSSRSLMSNGTSNSVSIVGGNNASFGRTAEANRSQSIAYGGGVAYSGVNVPSMRSSNPVVASAPSYVAIGATSSAPYQSFSSVSVPNYCNGQSGVSVYGGTTGRTSASPMSRVGGRPGSGFGGNGLGDAWLGWLDGLYGEGLGEGGEKTFTYGQASELYNDWLDEFFKNNPTADPSIAPTFAEFWAWLYGESGNSYTINGHTYKGVPVEDIAPLFLLAFAYLAMLLFRRRIN